MVLDLTVQQVCEVFVIIAEDAVSAELLESRVVIDPIDADVRVEVLGINVDVVAFRRLEYAPLGALTAIRFKMRCCTSAQL